MNGTRIVLVRHGHSLAQEDGVAGGHDGCRGLSDLGRRQVRALAERLTATGELGEVAALYSSVLPRAVETADLLADALDAPSRHQDCGLCEVHIGEDGDGLSWTDIESRWPRPDTPLDSAWRPTPTSESWSEMLARVRQALDDVVERHAGSTVVIATHGGVVGAAMQRMLRLSARPHDDGRAYLDTRNTSLTEFRHGPIAWDPSATPSWRLERYNDASHLAALDPFAP